MNTDELERDVGHGRDDAGDSYRQRQPTVTKAAVNEICGGDVAMLVTDMPKSWEHQEQNRIDHDRIRHSKERDCARAESERRNRDECVGGIEVTTDEEPSDDSTEASAAQTPFVQLIEVTLAPVGGGKSYPGYETK